MLRAAIPSHTAAENTNMEEQIIQDVSERVFQDGNRLRASCSAARAVQERTCLRTSSQ